MLISINLEVINQEENYRNLDRLLMLFEAEKHEWYLEDEWEAVMNRNWPTQLSERHRDILTEILKKAYVRSANISNNEKRERGVFEVTTIGDSSLPNVIANLDDPLYIVLENETSDSFFLNRLFDIYPNPGKHLQKAKKANHFTFYPAGGRNEVIKTLKNLARKKEPPYKPRILVIIDSDKKYPTEPDNTSLKAIKDYCITEGISLHVLYKRELENYIPLEVLQKRVPKELNNVLVELATLTPDQWDFFDLEKGFQNSPPKNEDQLFSEFSDRKNPRYQNLRNGFHKSGVLNVKQEWYKFVLEEEFNSKNIENRCNHQFEKFELKKLLIQISNML